MIVDERVRDATGRAGKGGTAHRPHVSIHYPFSDCSPGIPSGVVDPKSCSNLGYCALSVLEKSPIENQKKPELRACCGQAVALTRTKVTLQ